MGIIIKPNGGGTSDGANIYLSNLSTTGENKFTNPDLSNLSATGEAILEGRASIDLDNLSATGQAVIGAKVTEIYKKSWKLKEEVDNASTKEEVEKIKWNM